MYKPVSAAPNPNFNYSLSNSVAVNTKAVDPSLKQRLVDGPLAAELATDLETKYAMVGARMGNLKSSI